MQLIADLHTHTLASVHAYSTLLENVLYAKSHGMKALAMTDHSPAIPDAPDLVHFMNLKVIPEIIDDVRILRGVEANLIDYEGNIDVPSRILKSLDWVIASFHGVACEPGNARQNTNAYIEAAKNPYVDLIGHSGQDEFPYNYEKLIKTVKEYDKVIEINEASFDVRKGSDKNCPEIARLCKKYDVKVSVDSDSHFAASIGRFPKCLKMLEEIDFPEHLVINSDYDRLMEYINTRKNIKSK